MERLYHLQWLLQSFITFVLISVEMKLHYICGLTQSSNSGLFLIIQCQLKPALTIIMDLIDNGGDITGEGLQNLTYSRHSWPLNSEGSLARHIYCDMGHPFIMVISERLAMELSLPVFTTYVCRGWDSYTQSTACKGNALTHCATAVVKTPVD